MNYILEILKSVNLLALAQNAERAVDCMESATPGHQNKYYNTIKQGIAISSNFLNQLHDAYQKSQEEQQNKEQTDATH
jgi:hypothetical protein